MSEYRAPELGIQTRAVDEPEFIVLHRLKSNRELVLRLQQKLTEYRQRQEKFRARGYNEVTAARSTQETWYDLYFKIALLEQLLGHMGQKIERREFFQKSLSELRQGQSSLGLRPIANAFTVIAEYVQERRSIESLPEPDLLPFLSSYRK